MEQFIVGNDDCSFNRIILAMKKSPVFHLISSKWSYLALQLGTNDELQQQLQTQRRQFCIPNFEIILQILNEYRQREAENATLGNYMNALNGCDLADIVHCLKKEFQKNDCKLLTTTTVKENEEAVDGFDECVDGNPTSRQLLLHLKYYWMDLIDRTDLSNDLLEKLEAKNVLLPTEAALLKSKDRSEERNRRFYKILHNKIEKEDTNITYDTMFQICSEDYQNRENGVSCLLSRVFE